MNKVILFGNVGKDVELKFSPNGNAYTKLSIATSESKKKEDGTWENVSEWHNVMVFGKRAEKVATDLKKGSKVYIEGKIQTTKKDEKYFTSILCDKIDSLDFVRSSGDKNVANTQDKSHYNNVKPSGDFTSDDIPF